ncbi:MAG TPA: glutathione-disulfide reductase, partial [Polyangiaceae bacterium]|nr:glutathione-disulfide reductase [Polyangiaceae bacterium]
MEIYDLIVIGGGSGGLATARRASSHGKRVALVEHDRLGGTCVNRGCVPKKLWHDTAAIVGALHEARHMGFAVQASPPSWASIRERIDRYIENLNGIYARNLENDRVTRVQGQARFIDPHTVVAGSHHLQAQHIVIATGARPKSPPIEGGHLALVSDDFFRLTELPSRCLIIGGGYIGMEFAGILSSFGSKVTLVETLDRVLAPFDHEISSHAHALYERLGIDVHVRTSVKRIEASHDGFSTSIQSGDGSVNQKSFDVVLSAVGRAPNVENLGLDSAGVQLDDRGFIRVNDEERTSAPHIYAVGDVTGRPALTPVAIKAGRRLADRLYTASTEKMRYDTIPTAVFTPVEIGVVGLTEAQAIDRFGSESVKVYRAEFKPMRKALMPDSPVRAFVKMVVAHREEKVVGLHLIGPEAAEIIQGFSVAITAGLTKKQFDDTLA